MITSPSRAAQPAGTEDLQPQQDRPLRQAQQSPGAATVPASVPHGGRRQQQQEDFAHRPATQQQQHERQQHLVDAEDDPASDANTASANHPNDDDE